MEKIREVFVCYHFFSRNRTTIDMLACFAKNTEILVLHSIAILPPARARVKNQQAERSLRALMRPLLACARPEAPSVNR